jgi:ubiquinone biosynthesis protein COQ9
MIAPPERSAERDAAIRALLPHVPSHGWTLAALRAALADAGADPLDAGLMFPGGAAEMVEAYIDLADRTMAGGLDLSGLRTPGRVRALITNRLAQARGDKEAIRRALAVLACPRNARVAGRTTARTVDAIWFEAGDRSADFSWYTKRATLAGVYGATLLFWLRDMSEDDAATLAFLDRRLAGVARIGRLRRRIEEGCARRRPGSQMA